MSAPNSPLHRTTAELLDGLPAIAGAPADEGPLELIVRRPSAGDREVMTQAELDVVEGLVGDSWRSRGSRSRPDGTAHPDRQVTIVNSRAIALIAGERSRWPLAGDQLYVDLDTSEGNLPAGTRLRLGDALLEITDMPHTGCAKFVERYGRDALRFVNAEPAARPLRLRGIYARVVEPGTIRVGDRACKVSG
jgi:MOSC domain-containing protein YiiM